GTSLLGFRTVRPAPWSDPGAELSTSTLSERFQGKWQELAVGGRKNRRFTCMEVYFSEQTCPLLRPPADRRNPSFSAKQAFSQRVGTAACFLLTANFASVLRPRCAPKWRGSGSFLTETALSRLCGCFWAIRATGAHP